MKKKICIIGPAYPYRGGNALFVAHLYDALSQTFDVTIINFKRLYPQILFPGTRQEDISKVGIKVHNSERIIDSINPLTWMNAVKRIREINADLIAIIWYQPFFGMCLSYISGKLKKYFPNKLLFITENVISHESRFIDKYLTKITLKNADKFLVLSDIVEKEIKRLYPDKKLFRSSLPIYDCYKFEDEIDKTKLQKRINIPENKKVILFFGYIREYKGLIYLIQAIPYVIKKFSDIYLLIVGEFYDKKEIYYEEIEKLNIKNNVKIVAEFVPNEDIGLYYGAADLVVLPYNTATQSGVLNIAYGFKKPVLVTRVGGLPDLVIQDETGLIAEPKDPQSLAEKIIHFYELSGKVDFEENIEKYISKSSFNSIENIFNNINNN